jgi:hypothetical protein
MYKNTTPFSSLNGYKIKACAIKNPKHKESIHSLWKQRVRRTVALPFTLKSILRQKKNCGNSNISPCKDIIFTKSSKRNQNPSRYYYNSIITKSQVSTQATISIFQKSSFKKI